MNIQDDLRLPMFPDQLHYLVDLSTRIKLYRAEAELEGHELNSAFLFQWGDHRIPLRHRGDVRCGMLVEFVDDLVFDLFNVLSNLEPHKPVDDRRIEVLWQYIRYLEDYTQKVEVKS
jgi:hypothetical protein